MISPSHWLKTATLVLAWGAAAETAAAADVPVHRVISGTLDVTVTERGVVEASRSENAYCRVEGKTTIVWILPEGSLVTRGQLICELDPAPFRDQLAEEAIAEKQAEANYQNARLTREVAEVAVREYLAAKSGDDQKTLKELKAQVEKCRSEELTKQAAWNVVKIKVKKLETDIARCQIFAPADGLLEYANDKTRLNVKPVIVNGGTVRERQIIARILDVGGPMQVNTKVPAAVIKQVKRGQKARIRVELLPGQELNGVVRSVAPLPDPTNFFARNDLKRHTTHVGIEKAPAGLRIGMAAQVEIVASKLEDVLSVPVEAVVHHAGKDQVAVKNSAGTFEWREVTLGQSNPRFVEVKKGIKSGDLVAIEPRSVLSEKP